MSLAFGWLLSYLALGAGVGLLAGLLGIGGGAVMVPAFTSMFIGQGLNADSAMFLALGSSMGAIVPTSIASMRAHNRHGGVLWAVIRPMVPGILAGTFIATFLVPSIGSHYLTIIFTLFIAYVSVQMILDRKPAPGRVLPGTAGLVSAGAAIGGFSALVSIGGGTLTTPFLVWHNISIRQAIGTSAAAGVPISMAGTLGYIINGWDVPVGADYVLGFVYLPAVACVALSSYFFAPLGAKLTHSLPVPTVKKLFALLLILLCAHMAHSVYTAA